MRGDTSFFTTADGTWFTPTGACRGPWDPNACHAGPPTGLLARASELAVPDQQLVRITVDLTRPVPHAGFRIETEVVRSGRTVSSTEMRLFDHTDKQVVIARGLHMRTDELGDLPTTPYPQPDFAEAAPGSFPILHAAHDLPFFAQGVEARYNPGDLPTPGPTRAWLRTLPLLDDEDPSPFQRICPLADCGNAFSRLADDFETFAFMNTDLTVLLHRAPIGEWFGMDSVSRWEPTGLGMSDSLLFDTEGAVGRALQSLLIQRP